MACEKRVGGWIEEVREGSPCDGAGEKRRKHRRMLADWQA